MIVDMGIRGDPLNFKVQTYHSGVILLDLSNLWAYFQKSSQITDFFSVWLRKHKLSLLQPHVEYQQQWWHPVKKQKTKGNLARFPTPLLLEESGLETLSGENHASDEMAELVQEKRKCKNNKQKYKVRHLAEKNRTYNNDVMSKEENMF